jgi:hypothetical protein
MSTAGSSPITSPLGVSASGTAVRYRHHDSHGYSALCARGVDPLRHPRSRRQRPTHGAGAEARGHTM